MIVKVILYFSHDILSDCLYCRALLQPWRVVCWSTTKPFFQLVSCFIEHVDLPSTDCGAQLMTHTPSSLRESDGASWFDCLVYQNGRRVVELALSNMVRCRKPYFLLNLFWYAHDHPGMLIIRHETDNLNYYCFSGFTGTWTKHDTVKRHIDETWW